MRAAVFGSGAWGTTFAAVLADAGCEVTLWGRDADVVDEVNGAASNARFLPGVSLPAAVRATTDAASALDGAQLVAVALPSQHVRSIVSPFAGAFRPTPWWCRS